MTKLKDTLNQILKALSQKDFKILGKYKGILFIVLALLVFIPLTIWLLSDSAQSGDEVVNNILESQKEETRDYVPPKMDNPFVMDLAENTKQEEAKDSNASKEESLNVDLAGIPKDADKEKIPTISNQNNGISDSQLDAIKKIAKAQKPEEMIPYLKEIQKDCELNKTQLTFKFEGKELKAGDKLNSWYLIEEITKNYVRFKETNYAYNLRFIGID